MTLRPLQIFSYHWNDEGGTTYTALATLHIAPPLNPLATPLTPSERERTIRWLVQNQDASGGFRGRTGKEADACYCFWCGASLQVR
jgi:geranylgeranyl transferase type-1 subunit beta